MKVLQRFGRHIAAVLIAAGVLLVFLSFSLLSQPQFVDVWLAGNDTPVTVTARGPYPADWLAYAGIRVFPQDAIIFNGLRVPFDIPLPRSAEQKLLYKPAIPVTLTLDGDTEIFYSGAETLGKALWERNIYLKESDYLSEEINSPLDSPISAVVIRGEPVRFKVGGEEFTRSVAARKVGEALAEARLSLQMQDYSKPDIDAPIPENRVIRLVRVREEVLAEETAIPYANERVSDPNMTVGEEQVLQTGEFGVQSTIVRIRYEDGEETSRTVLSEWVSKPPVNERVAYGGNIVVQAIDTSEGSVDYWLAKEVYITSYLDTGNPTASGIWPYYGVIAVTPEWYSILKGTSIYVPGYGVGTVLDVCPGCVGKPWIDVFIPTDQYVPWSRTETVYFLPPAPDGFSGELP